MRQLLTLGENKKLVYERKLKAHGTVLLAQQ